MHNKDDEIIIKQQGLRLQKIQVGLTVLFGLIASSPFLLPKIKYFATLLNKLSLRFELPILTIQLLIVLILFVILSLVLSSLCFYKNRELKLPNKKETGKLLKFLAVTKYPCFFRDKYAASFGIDESMITLYLKTLITFGYLIDNGYISGFIKGKRRKSYEVTDDGIKFLVKHNFIK